MNYEKNEYDASYLNNLLTEIIHTMSIMRNLIERFKKPNIQQSPTNIYLEPNIENVSISFDNFFIRNK